MKLKGLKNFKEPPPPPTSLRGEERARKAAACVCGVGWGGGGHVCVGGGAVAGEDAVKLKGVKICKVALPPSLPPPCSPREEERARKAAVRALAEARRQVGGIKY